MAENSLSLDAFNSLLAGVRKHGKSIHKFRAEYVLALAEERIMELGWQDRYFVAVHGRVTQSGTLRFENPDFEAAAVMMAGLEIKAEAAAEVLSGE